MRAEPGRGERVVVAMSGGVDSSLAAALVVAQGCEAIGVTMHLAGSGSRCCSLADADDARAVADRLGIRFFVANYAERFRAEVIEAFADDYLAGVRGRRFVDPRHQRAAEVGLAGGAPRSRGDGGRR